MEGNTGPIEWMQEWLDWLHREWIGLWQELQDTEGRERVWTRIKAHLRKWIVYYVFGVILLVVMYGLWMDGDGEGERMVRRTGRGNVKGLMTGGGAEGSTNYPSTLTVAQRKQLFTETSFPRSSVTPYKEANPPKYAQPNIEGANPLKQNSNPNITMVNPVAPQTTGDNEGGGKGSGKGSGNKGGAGNPNRVNRNVNIMNKKVITDEFKRKLSQNLIKGRKSPLQTPSTVNEQFTKVNAAIQANSANNIIQPSSNLPTQPHGIPISNLKASASSSVNVSVSIESGARTSAPAPAAPAANVPKQPAKSNTPAQTESGAKPPAGQQPPAQQQAPGPQKGSRKDQGADAIKAAVDAVNQKKAQKQAKKTERNKQGKQYAAQAKEVSKQFKRPSAGSAEAGRLLDEVKRGVGQQFDKIGSILFSFLTAAGLATAAGVTVLKETGYEPPKKVATMAMHI